MNSLLKRCAACFVLLLLAGCSSAPIVTREEIKERIDLSGHWNDYDSQLVSEEMVQDCLSSAWVDNFIMEEGRKPVVIVGDVINRSHEHINAEVFLKFLEREVLNSGRVIFVAGAEEREQLRAEREDQRQGFTAVESMARFGRERGADFMLIGSINSVKDEIKKKYVIFYQTNLELVDLETNEKVWIGQQEIKKTVEKRGFSM
ncbi:MAG: penicillin-binding protein activator LpoB [Candidatus Omnitrophica bacterium]|nr:penicillin-binding protein activator LpoB [Candidatus Omnitrophota bacterium]